jgi:hypothetical protein
MLLLVSFFLIHSRIHFSFTLALGKPLSLLHPITSHHRLHDQRARASAAVTDARAADAAFARLQHAQQRGQNTGPARAERMAHRDGAAVHIDLVGLETQQLGVGQRNDAEGLVDLVGGDLGGLDAGVRERLGDRERGRRRELAG